MQIADNLTVEGTLTTTGGQTTSGVSSTTPQVVAATGITVGAAAAITSSLVFVTTTTLSTRGVKLPAATAGMYVTVVVPQTLSVVVYPNTTAHIGTGAANAGLKVTGLKSTIFYAKDATHWWTTVGA